VRASTRYEPYRYDERGNVIASVQTHPGQPNLGQDRNHHLRIQFSRELDQRTIVRAVNPVDEEGQALEEAVEVMERRIVYGDGCTDNSLSDVLIKTPTTFLFTRPGFS
jgi:hypothetical protein